MKWFSDSRGMYPTYNAQAHIIPFWLHMCTSSFSRHPFHRSEKILTMMLYRGGVLARGPRTARKSTVSSSLQLLTSGCLKHFTMKLAAAILLALLAPSSGFVATTSKSTTTPSSNLFALREQRQDGTKDSLSKLILASFVSISLLSAPLPAMADGQTEKFKLPPIDFNDKTRCSMNSSTIGQANAARDKLYDLRQCKLSGASAPGYDLSGVIMSGTDVSKANFKEAYFSKGYLQCKSNLHFELY
jgi:Pentapeptide repeats (8 copies)